MDMQSYIDEVKFKLSGGVIDLEINDDGLKNLINASFREVQRYIDSTKLATIPYAQCIDMNNTPVSSVVRVYRANSYYSNGGSNDALQLDPMYASQWQIYGGGSNSMYNLRDWIYNYAAWNTMLQIRNTMSTDLAFRYDKDTSRLYINISGPTPNYITIEYVPRYNNVEEILSDYWIDIIMRMAVANGKIILGRIRGRFTQSNALWTQDAETMLNEGNTELTNLRQQLEQSTQLCYGID